jgi:phosphoribosylformylglycinamidine synthase
LIADGVATAVHDVSDGGLLVALAEMAMASGLGAELKAPPLAGHAFWFGEDQGRYVVTVRAGDADKVTAQGRAAGIPVRSLGTTGGDALTLAGERPILVTKLRESFEGWLPAYMAGGTL